MALTYTVKDQHGLYFITCTVHQWIDVFTKKQYVDILLDSLAYCQNNKGLEIFAWVIMSNHLHLIARTQTHSLSDVVRDFKKFTAKEIIRAIETNEKESRKNWLLWLLKKDGHIWFWEEGYHGEEISGEDFFQSKLTYIHMNPVRAGIVEKAEEYLYSSCSDYFGMRKNRLKLCYAQ